MRLYEITDSFADDLKLALGNLSGRGAVKHTPVTLSWQAVTNLLKSEGYGKIDYDTFASEIDQDPKLKELLMTVVDDFNENGLVLKTGVPSQQDKTQLPVDLGGKTVDQMAHNAVKDLTR